MKLILTDDDGNVIDSWESDYDEGVFAALMDGLDPSGPTAIIIDKVLSNQILNNKEGSKEVSLVSPKPKEYSGSDLSYESLTPSIIRED